MSPRRIGDPSSPGSERSAGTGSNRQPELWVLEDNPKIREEFEYLVTADNIGRGIANDLELHIFPPSKDMELIGGAPGR